MFQHYFDGAEDTDGRGLMLHASRARDYAIRPIMQAPRCSRTRVTLIWRYNIARRFSPLYAEPARRYATNSSAGFSVAIALIRDYIDAA